MQKFSRILMLLLVYVAGAGTLFAQPGNTHLYIIDEVTVIDATGKPEQPGMRVVVKDELIQSVESMQAHSRTPRGAKTIDGKGKFLIPGLWDMHVHLVDVDEPALPVYPLYGITSVRDMGGDVAKLMAWRKRIDSGHLVGPRIKMCGPMLEGKWEQKPGARTDHWQVLTPEEARSTVNKLADQGVDCIKMRTFASPETYFALVAAARERGLLFGGHAPWGVDPIASSNAGQVSYEHAFYPWPWNDVPPEKKLEIENTFRKNGSMIVPTLVAWDVFRLPFARVETVVNDVDAKSDPGLKLVTPALRKNWISGLADMKPQGIGSPGWGRAIDQVYEQVAEMHEHGVGVMTGTDTGATMVYPAAALHDELRLLVAKCRFTPMDALLSATIIPAKFFKMADRLGTIEKGKIADLVLLAADPLQDITNTQKIDGVMINGKWLDHKTLARIRAKVENDIATSNKRTAH